MHTDIYKLDMAALLVADPLRCISTARQNPPICKIGKNKLSNYESTLILIDFNLPTRYNIKCLQSFFEPLPLRLCGGVKEDDHLRMTE